MGDRSGLTYYRARYYDPEIGRFLSEDPLRSETTKSILSNHYSYGLNNPINLTDPSKV